jgi:hypothetical protein
METETEPMQNVMPQTLRLGKLLGIALAVLMVSAASSFAHCDTMDGPVVKAAQSALKAKNVNFVLIWVSKKDESEVKEAFRLALHVRVLNREARQLADKYFFETVVRLHRAGEGQPYTGLKPAGTNIDPVIRAADKALDNGSPEELVKFFPENIRAEVEDRFRNTVSRKKFHPNDVEAGRRYVEAYVSLLEYLERVSTGESRLR